MKGKIKLLHSFPPTESKFKEYCDLTFRIKQFDNTFVASLDETNVKITDFDLIFIHYLRKKDIQFLNKNDPDIPIVWFFWGAELFNSGRIQNRFLLDKTKSLKDRFYTKNIIGIYIKYLIRIFLPFLSDWTPPQKKIRVIDKFNYIVPVMPGDYSILKESYKISPKLHHLNYVNPLIEQSGRPYVDGQNILLGNSASFTNNHIEAIDKLSEIKLSNRKVIIPLSYGREDLENYISEYAKKKLGENRVRILRKFLPFEEYNKIIISCEIVVMNHLRQQAVGNIVQALYNGSHVYLRPESTVYKYLIDQGIKVSNFEKFKVLVPLKEQEKVDNRRRTKEVFGAKRQRGRLEQLIDKVLDNE